MSSSRDKKPSSSRAGGIRTLSDLNRASGYDSDSNSDAPQEFYTGGEKSGMLVQGPSKGHDVDSIFDQARQLGGVPVPLESLQPSSSSRSFTGTGRSLSSETVQPGPQQPVQSGPQQPEPVVHDIVFWRNGFTVDNGPLRRLDDPQNAPFLESIVKSECPKELEPADRRTPVHVNLIRRQENRPEIEAPSLPFQGVGRTLGSSSATEPVPEATGPATLHGALSPSPGLVVDRSQPSTAIQLRLADGTRMVAHLNHHHTIADIRSFIDASRTSGSRTYQLQSVGFPPKILNDNSQTIEQAGLLNSVVIQKF